MAADGRSRSAETEMTAPPPQDQRAKDVSATEASAAAGLCLLWSKVVESLIASFVSAPEPVINLLAEIEAELEEAVLPDPDADLQPPEDVQEPAPECQENARVVLEVSPER